jgi:hypothetical protein
MRLWFEKHQRAYHELSEFEDDDIEDFAGHDLIEDDDDEEVDQNDMSWLHPPKGPGEFKNLKKKKKGRKNKKKKGKKNKKRKSK